MLEFLSYFPVKIERTCRYHLPKILKVVLLFFSFVTVSSYVVKCNAQGYFKILTRQGNENTLKTIFHIHLCVIFNDPKNYSYPVYMYNEGKFVCLIMSIYEHGRPLIHFHQLTDLSLVILYL